MLNRLRLPLQHLGFKCLGFKPRTPPPVNRSRHLKASIGESLQLQDMLHSPLKEPLREPCLVFRCRRGPGYAKEKGQGVET